MIHRTFSFFYGICFITTIGFWINTPSENRNVIWTIALFITYSIFIKTCMINYMLDDNKKDYIYEDYLAWKKNKENETKNKYH
jgi:hypothetical protein